MCSMDRTLLVGITVHEQNPTGGNTVHGQNPTTGAYCAWTKLGALTFSLVHPHLVLVTIRPTRMVLVTIGLLFILS
jgi:hypothetical protein